MLSLGEIYFLNQALDSKDIYGLNGEEVLKNKTEYNDKAMDSLRNKNILNNDYSINESSYLLIKNLEKYKNADTYVWINDMVLADVNEDHMIFIRKDNIIGEYEFRYTLKIHLFIQILKQYSFLREYNYNVKNENIYMDIADFISVYILNKKEDDILILRKNIKNSLCDYYVYVYDNGIVLKYDVIKEYFIEMNPKDVRVEIYNFINSNYLIE